MTQSHVLQDFLTPGASSRDVSVKSGKSTGPASRSFGMALAMIRRAVRSRDIGLMAKELETCHAALLRLNRAAILASLGSTISHELNQPLATIVGQARAGQRWLTGAQPSLLEAGASLAEIERAAWRASAIIDSVRALMAADTSGYAVFDLNDAVCDMFKVLDDRGLNGDISHERILSATPLWLRGDRVQIQQVLLNLAINAIEAMDDTSKPKQLTIRVGSARGSAILEVSDTGPGLSPAKISRIFEPLYTTKPDGVGMGLAICRQIAESHGGQLDARSRREGGAVFTLSLPRASAPSPDSTLGATKAVSGNRRSFGILKTARINPAWEART